MSLSVILARRYMPCLDGIRRVVRHISALAGSPYDNTKLVYISESRDVFDNLALEHWMYRHFDFSKQHILLLWRNSPRIVFGRDQNPWLDCDIPVASKENLLVIR
ncbi:Lipoyl amidotransferase LIPT1, mitochondrial [Formica fusca]